MERHREVSKQRLWAGRTISAIAVLFLLFDSVIKLVLIDPVVASFAQLGYPVVQSRPTCASAALSLPTFCSRLMLPH
jgi:hypothetical protein